MPDLAGISRNGVESTVDTEGDRQVTDESSPLQRTKRKVKLNLGVINSQRLIIGIVESDRRPTCTKNRIP